MKVVRILILVLLLPTLAFAQYKIVLKNGKVIEGKYVQEDQANIYIESNGIQMNFKKDKLDLDKMTELNAKITAPEETPPQKPSPPKTPAKKPARVYTTEDLKQMKEIWNEGSEETTPGNEATPAPQTMPVTQPAPVTQMAPVTQPAPVTQMAPVTQPAPVTQTAPVTQAAPVTPTAPVTQTAPEAQTPPAESVVPAVPAPELQTQPDAPVEPAGPRDEKTIQDELDTVRLKIAETEARIQDLKSKDRVTTNWEKLLAKQRQNILDLQQEMKASIAARKAAKKATQQQK